MDEQQRWRLQAHEYLWEIRENLLKFPLEQRATALECMLQAASAVSEHPEIVPEMDQIVREFMQEICREGR